MCYYCGQEIPSEGRMVCPDCEARVCQISCQGCRYRVMGCHAWCPGYARFRAARSRMREKNMAISRADSVIYDSIGRIRKRR